MRWSNSAWGGPCLLHLCLIMYGIAERLGAAADEEREIRRAAAKPAAPAAAR